jgi:hypothetical protein
VRNVDKVRLKHWWLHVDEHTREKGSGQENPNMGSAAIMKEENKGRGGQLVEKQAKH